MHCSAAVGALLLSPANAPLELLDFLLGVPSNGGVCNALYLAIGQSVPIPFY